MTTDELRAKFEAWITSPPFEMDITKYPANDERAWPGSYCSGCVEIAWEAWKEGYASLDTCIEAPRMIGVAKTKLAELQAQGYVINGYALMRPNEHDVRVMIDSAGHVRWLGHSQKHRSAMAMESTHD